MVVPQWARNSIMLGRSDVLVLHPDDYHRASVCNVCIIVVITRNCISSLPISPHRRMLRVCGVRRSMERHSSK